MWTISQEINPRLFWVPDRGLHLPIRRTTQHCQIVKRACGIQMQRFYSNDRALEEKLNNLLYVFNMRSNRFSAVTHKGTYQEKSRNWYGYRNMRLAQYVTRLTNYWTCLGNSLIDLYREQISEIYNTLLEHQASAYHFFWSTWLKKISVMKY